MRCKISLKAEQGAADFGDSGDDRGGGGHGVGAQPRIVEEPRIDALGGRFGGHRIGGIAVLVEHEAGGRTIQGAGVELGQSKALGKAARERALA
jgi:hypothetical protein